MPSISSWVPAVALATSCAAATAADWPQFRGPERSGRSPESGLLKQWPRAGPKLLATIVGAGEGWASSAVVGEHLFTTGRVGTEIVAFCFKVDGTKVWEAPLGPGFSKSYPGARATPTIDGEVVYVMSCLGKLAALEKASGKTIWTLDLREAFAAQEPKWGYAESVLIDGERLICTPGGPDAAVVALDKKSGKLLWSSKGFSATAAYSSPILVQAAGKTQIVSFTSKGLSGVSADDGILLWQTEQPRNETANCNGPLFAEGLIFAANGYNAGAVALTIAADGKSAKVEWQSKDMNCLQGGYVADSGHVYGATEGALVCIDLKDGTTKWKVGRAQDPALAAGSIIWADGLLYYMTDRATVMLIEASPQAFKLVSAFKLPNAGPDSFAHPAIAAGKLVLRRSNRIFIYELKPEQGP